MKRKPIVSIALLTGCLLNASLLFGGDLKQHRSISQKNLIKSSMGRWSDGRFEIVPVSSMDAETPQTLHIGALLVEFQPDQDDRTTGTGQFDSSESESLLDPSPHDIAYFSLQLTALKNYYQNVSRGRLLLDPTVIPQIFVLPDSMAVYNPATTDEETDKGLVRLLRDAVTLADAAGYDLSSYESLIVFHAGVGKDIDLGGYDPTPSDIPSAFVNLDDLKSVLAPEDPDYQGISIQGGAHFIEEAIILPETENQLDYEVGLLGTEVLMFGFQLGLPALWDTNYGRSGIGRWGLMDQGSGNFNGLIPAGPSAFSKVFLGWVDPIVVTEGEALPVACVNAGHEASIYKIPINDHEYFLIENRQYDANKDSVAIGRMASGAEVVFYPDQTIAVSEAGVIVSVDDYDFGLPGSGILIWHIDESVIKEKIAENAINTDQDHRGVDLEEADGAQDIGYSYGMLSGGYGSENGVLQDAWYGNNDIHMLANNSDEVAFTPYTYPNTRANSGANSHIRVYDFSSADTVMTFSVNNGLVINGFPMDVGEGEGLLSPTYGDLDGDGTQEVVVLSKSGNLFAWHMDKTPLVQTATGMRHNLIGDLSEFEVPLFTKELGAATLSPVTGDLNHDEKDEVYVAAGSQLTGWELANGVIYHYMSSDLNQTITAMLIVDESIVVGTAGGGLYQSGFDAAFEEIAQFDQPITALSASSSATSEVVVGSGSRIVTVSLGGERQGETDLESGSSIHSLTSGGGESGTLPVLATDEGIASYLESQSDLDWVYHSSVPSTLALADLNADGYRDIVFSKEGKILALQYNGSMVSNFPVPAYERDVVLSDPLIADVDGDAALDVIVATSEGTIEAYNIQGEMIEGFPLSTGDTAAITPTIVDLDGDGDVELLAATADGLCFGWDLAGKTSSLVWGCTAKDAQNSALNLDPLGSVTPGSDWMPENLVYNYPNPTQGNSTTVRYRLEQDATVEIKIYDLAGHLVDEFAGPGEGQIDHDVTWDLSDVDSGVYFCQVRASRNGEEKVATIKIAVVK